MLSFSLQRVFNDRVRLPVGGKQGRAPPGAGSGAQPSPSGPLPLPALVPLLQQPRPTEIHGWPPHTSAPHTTSDLVSGPAYNTCSASGDGAFDEACN